MGDVDLADFTIFGGRLGAPDVTTPPPGCDLADFTAADLDGDCDVDLEDFAMMQARFTGPIQ